MVFCGWKDRPTVYVYGLVPFKGLKWVFSGLGYGRGFD